MRQNSGRFRNYKNKIFGDVTISRLCEPLFVFISVMSSSLGVLFALVSA